MKAIVRKLSMGIFEPSDGTAPAGTEEMSGRIVDGSAADVTAVVTATETKRLDRFRTDSGRTKGAAAKEGKRVAVIHVEAEASPLAQSARGAGEVLGEPPVSPGTPASVLSARLSDQDAMHVQQKTESQTLVVSSHCPPSLRRDSWSLEDFEVKAQMYKGKISLVYHVVDKRSGLSLALKMYKRCKLNEIERRQVSREIRLHSDLDHPSIIKLYAAWKDRAFVFMALELALAGDVYSYMAKQGGKLEEHTAVCLVLEPFLSGLASIHDKGLIHRDIKPENILLTREAAEVKIADFGLSIDSRCELANTRLGTVDYLAPEILDCPVKEHPDDNKDNPSIGYTNKVDCWSVGVLLYEMLLGRPPFKSPTAVETLRAIRTRQVEYPPELSPDARAFIQSVLIHSPEARPTVAQLLASPLIKHHMERKINTAKRTHANGYFLQGHATLDVDTYVNSSSQPSPFTFAPVAAGGAAGSASALGKGVGASQGTSIAVPKASASSSVAKSLPALNCISKSLAGVSVSSTGSGNSDGGGSGGGPPLSPTGIALLNAQAATYGKPDAASLFRSTRPSPQSKSGILPPAAPTPAAAHAPPPAGHAFHSPILNPPTNSTSPFASPGANAAANAKVAEVAADMGATATAGSRGSGKPAATGLMMRISNMRRAKSVNADLSRKGS